MDKTTLKSNLLKQLNLVISKRIDTAQSAMKAAQESRDNETKSSAGDKFETGRAMMQIEEEKNRVQLIKAMVLKKELSLIDAKQIYDKAGLGALVKTNKGSYFLSIGIGKMNWENEVYYAISMASPVGKLLYGKEVGDKISFNGMEYELVDLF